MHWYNEVASCLLSPPTQVKQELFGIASLTKRISSFGAFSVQLLQQDNGQPTLEESQCLGRFGLANIREVYLYCDGVPVVFAHTVLPLSSLQRELKQLTSLGNKSLGAILHTARHISAQAPEITLLSKKEALFQQAISKIMEHKPPQLWARRTVYYSRREPLLVHEVFLPAYWKLV